MEKAVLMKTFYILYGLLPLLIISCSAQSPEAVNNLDQFVLIPKEQTEIIYLYAKNLPNETHLSFAFIDKDTTQLLDVKRTNDTLHIVPSKDYIFEIGSITKAFTSTLLADAVINERIGLEDVIPVSIKDDIEITYEQLSNHTSGLPRLPKNIFSLASFRTDNPYKDYNVALLEEYLANEVVLDQMPGEKSAYSNLGAGLLGHVLSKNAGVTYEDLLQSQIFTQYEMSNSTSIKEKVLGNLVMGRDKNGVITSHWDMASLKGAGAIYSSASDLATFANAHFYEDNAVFKLSRKRTFPVNTNMDIALGWHIINTQSGEQWHWHNGGTGGYSSSMVMNIENKKAVILLTNVSAFNKLQKNIDLLCFALMKSLK